MMDDNDPRLLAALPPFPHDSKGCRLTPEKMRALAKLVKKHIEKIERPDETLGENIMLGGPGTNIQETYK